MDSSIITHLVTGLIGLIAGYTISVTFNSNKTIRSNSKVQKGNTVGGNMSGGDMNINNLD